MSDNEPSFRTWILDQLRPIFSQQAAPLVLWCDPDREWLGLLRDVQPELGFTLWPTPEEEPGFGEELLLRHRLFQVPPEPRVLWLPCAPAQLTWLQVFALEAAKVWDLGLPQALREFGVALPQEVEAELGANLRHQAQEWFTEPRSKWRDLSPAHVKEVLLTPGDVLDLLAGQGEVFAALHRDQRFALLRKRASEDFGLPDPQGLGEAAWRLAALARLLATDAAEEAVRHHLKEPVEPEAIIPPGRSRRLALELLLRWQNDARYVGSFTALAPSAEATLGLRYWARSAPRPPRSRSARAVEEALFQATVERLDRIEAVDALAEALRAEAPEIGYRAEGLWARIDDVRVRVPWQPLYDLCAAAGPFLEAPLVDAWQRALDAVTWYHQAGWMLEREGERLGQERSDLPESLFRVRQRLRRGYLQIFDRVGQQFSVLLARDATEVLQLPTPGELALGLLSKGLPTAYFVLDACRLDLGHRLKELLREGEPVDRAQVHIARSPLPSITALGMAFALPLLRGELRVALFTEKDGRARFRVQQDGFAGNLADAEARRTWLKTRLPGWTVTCLKIAEVLADRTPPRPKTNKSLLMVHGDEFNQDGHNGQLERRGAEDHLHSYVAAVQRLKKAGWRRIILVTNHGFFCYRQEKDELLPDKPQGEVLFRSRRAFVGRGLRHGSALKLPVTGGDLEVMVPRGVAAFETYGGLGYFHGGATLQELIVPVLVAQWPSETKKAAVKLTALPRVTGNAPLLELYAQSIGAAQLDLSADQQSGRRVQVIIRDATSGRAVFRLPAPVVVPSDGRRVKAQLHLLDDRPSLTYGAELEIEAHDADDGTLLDRQRTELRTDIDDL